MALGIQFLFVVLGMVIGLGAGESPRVIALWGLVAIVCFAVICLRGRAAAARA